MVLIEKEMEQTPEDLGLFAHFRPTVYIYGSDYSSSRSYYITGFPLHFAIGGTFGLILYFCTLSA